MDALLQLMSCFLNAIMYMILIYYFLPFKLQFKEITILFTILSTNMFLINKVGNYGVIFLLISVSIYLMFIRKHRLTRAHREKQLKTSCQALHNAPPNRT